MALELKNKCFYYAIQFLSNVTIVITQYCGVYLYYLLYSTLFLNLDF